MMRRPLVLLALLALPLLLASCESEKNENPFSNCGNAACDGDEECDDGAATGGQDPESDRCLSSCKLNRCGDGFLKENASPPGSIVCGEIPSDVVDQEECDPGQLEPIPCSDFGLTGDVASCGDDCRFDTSSCGAPFTPTATATVTSTSSVTPTPPATATPTPTTTGTPPTATPTQTDAPTPTVTPTPLDTCGDRIVDVEQGETCDDGGICTGGDNDGLRCSTVATSNTCVGGENDGQSCESDGDCPGAAYCEFSCPGATCVAADDGSCPATCVIQSCDPATTRRTAAVTFAAPEDVTSVSFFVRYADGQVSLPGSGIVPSVQQRILMRQPGVSYIGNDLDFAVRVVVTATGGLTQQPAFTLSFDDCSGAEPPLASQFRCTVEACANEFGLIEGCECSIDLP
jgi:hypothetical protein